MARFSDLFPGVKPIIGMIHLPPLPDYPESPGIDNIIRHALRDQQLLEQAGVDGILIENEYDRPHRVTASADTIAAMAEITRAVVQESKKALVGCVPTRPVDAVLSSWRISPGCPPVLAHLQRATA